MTARPLLSDAQIELLLGADHPAWHCNVHDVLRELQQARAALRFYADDENYVPKPCGSARGLLMIPEVEIDHGIKARACLPAEDDAGSGVGVRG